MAVPPSVDLEKLIESAAGGDGASDHVHDQWFVHAFRSQLYLPERSSWWLVSGEDLSIEIDQVPIQSVFVENSAGFIKRDPFSDAPEIKFDSDTFDSCFVFTKLDRVEVDLASCRRYGVLMRHPAGLSCHSPEFDKRADGGVERPVGRIPEGPAELDCITQIRRDRHEFGCISFESIRF